MQITDSIWIRQVAYSSGYNTSICFIPLYAIRATFVIKVYEEVNCLKRIEMRDRGDNLNTGG